MRVRPQIGIGSYLTNFGHQVSWVIWSDGQQRVKPFLLSDVRVYVTPEIHYVPQSLLLGKVLNKIPNAVKRMRHILSVFKQGNCDLIFVRNDVFDGVTAAYIKRKHKVPFVFELSSPLDQAWEGYKIEERRPGFLYFLVAKWVEFVSKRLLREADLVLPTTKWFKEHLAEQGVPEAKMMPYPNGVDIESFSHRDDSRVRERYRLGNAKVVVYIGTLGKTRRLTALIQTIAAVVRERPHVKLLMVGEGSDEGNLRRLVRDLGITDDVIFTGQVPQHEVPDFIAASDIGVSPVPPFSFYKLSSPIKMFEYMAMAKPVVANEEIPEHKEVLGQSGGGILVPFTPEAFAAAIVKLLDDPDRAAELGRRGREWVLNNRTYEVLARQLEKRLLKVIAEN